MPNIESMTMQRSPLKIEFTGNYEGPQPGQRVHTITRPDLPPGTNTALDLETYLNGVWFPQELRDVNGSVMGYALVHVISFTPQDVDWQMQQSYTPIAPWW